MESEKKSPLTESELSSLSDVDKKAILKTYVAMTMADGKVDGSEIAYVKKYLGHMGLAFSDFTKVLHENFDEETIVAMFEESSNITVSSEIWEKILRVFHEGVKELIAGKADGDVLLYLVDRPSLEIIYASDGEMTALESEILSVLSNVSWHSKKIIALADNPFVNHQQ